MFRKIDISEWKFNVFDKFDKEWALLTVGDLVKHNAMTISWGTMGILWNKKIVLVFVRPTRFTNELLKENSYFNLQFFNPSQKKILSYCGSKSGRDVNKSEVLNLTPLIIDNTPCFEEAEMIITCKKIYVDSLNSENFLDLDTHNHYNSELRDYHDVFIGEVLGVYSK